MKPHNFAPVKFLIFVFACCFLASATTQSGVSTVYPSSREFADNAHVIVWRAADFGTIQYLDLAIDGVKVTTLGRNEGYQALVRPGPHVLSVNNAPSGFGRSHVTHHRVNLQPGQTYVFTALWEQADHVKLNPSDEAGYRNRARWY